jgi:tetratricopeptide (TPR) repeat protein
MAVPTLIAEGRAPGPRPMVAPALLLTALLACASGCGQNVSEETETARQHTATDVQAHHDQRQGKILNNRGALFLKQESPRRALNTLTSALELAPGLPDAHFNIGLVHARLGHHVKATAAFARAAELGFEHVDLDVAQGLSLRAQNRYAQARTAFDRAVRAAPQRADLHLHRGEVLRAMGSLDSALSSFDMVVRLDSSIGAAHRYRGELLAAAGDQQQAASAYAKAVRIDGADVTALVGQAEALRRLEEYAEATAALQQAVSHAPRMSRAYYVLASVAEGAGDQQLAAMARQSFKRLTEAQRYFDQGQVYARRGQFDDADVELSRAIGLDPDFADAWLRLGALRLENDQPAAALEVLQHLALQRPGYPEVHNLIGEAWLQIGHHDSALVAFGTSLVSNPSSVAAHIGSGRAHFAEKRFTEAQTEFRRALDLNPDEHEGYYFLGLVYAHQGRTREAVSSIEQCLAVKPNHVEAHYHLGRILSGNGDLPAARQHLNRALALNPDHSRAAQRLDALGSP